MKKLGLIGGMGPESTLPYYHDIVYGVQKKNDGNFPLLTIESVNVFDVLGYCARKEYDELVDYLMKSDRIGFSHWAKEDMDLASLLWGEKEVTKYICASGVFSQDDIKNRFSFEINNMEKTNVQYWPIFDISDGELIGCCGLRPYKNEKGTYEIGCHLRSKYWRQGYAFEGVKKVIDYAFNELNASRIYVGHLYILDEDKRADLKLLSKKIGSSRLSFASEKELYEYLKLTPGSVTPFGIINDYESTVIILLDEELKGEDIINFHPNINTATIGIWQNDLEKFIKFEQNKYIYV